jgi:hypothetical protein
MRPKTVLLTTVASALLAAASSANQDRVTTYCQSMATSGDMHAFARVEGYPGDQFALLVRPVRKGAYEFSTPSLVCRGQLGPTGLTTVEWVLHPPLPDVEVLETVAVLLGRSGRRVTEPSYIPLQSAVAELLDFNSKFGPVDPQRGELIHAQWAMAGLMIDTDNFFPTHPDKGIIFDSNFPTGGDFDLATPGYGPGNVKALGNLLIVAENDIDVAPADGFVDDPDDEDAGGMITFHFAMPAELRSITMVDIDDPQPTFVRFHHFGGGAPTVVAVPNMGDNSVQTLGFMVPDVVRMQVVFGGSGAIAEIGLNPCERVLMPDERTFGAPRYSPVGMWVTDQFQSELGVGMLAVNNVPSHPQKCIVFDSQSPTGEDMDLMTPGYGFGNTEALGELFIIAEDDVDVMPADGLVDDPDDEAKGGVLRWSFDGPAYFLGLTVVDIDVGETAAIHLLDAFGALVQKIDLQPLGDNSVQVVDVAPVPGVLSVELRLSGSGGATRLRWCGGEPLPMP